MIKSPLRYPGGKSRAVEKIAGLLPSSFEEFREPFVGGGSVFLYLRQLHPDKRYWINDLYTELYQFWQGAQRDVEALVMQVQRWRREHPDGKELYRFLQENSAQWNEVEKAAAFFMFNRITFSGTTEAGGYSEQAFRGRFTQSSIDRLLPFATLLEGVRITNDDYAALVNADGHGVCLYLDPPYYSAAKSALYGKKGQLHKIFDHERFAEVLKESPHRWLITYDDHPYIRELFAFANIATWEQTYGMKNITEDSEQKGKELFIANYAM